MKKTGLLLYLCLAAGAFAQQANQAVAGPDGTLVTTVGFPTERVQTPTAADLYCAGFVSEKRLPNANYVAGGLQTPNTTQFVNSDMVFLTGGGYQVGQQYTVVRELRDINRYELFKGQFRLIKSMGQPYAELARLRIVDTRSKSAIGQIEFSCDGVGPGDFVIPFAEKPAITFHEPIHFDRFLPASAKTSGRIVMAKDFDSQLGTGAKVYVNLGANQGVKVGDYFRAVRSYDADLHDSVDSLSFKAPAAEDTQRKPPSIEQKFLTKTGGPVIHVRDLPRRAVGEIVIIGTTPTTATGMIVFALEDVHLGDYVELDQ
ncbi:MAG: hypothetical protein JST79_12870 [Acidobacteria bacterium]|nr:hypothetical protein [Acidobacteriota bacterium]